MFNRKQREQKIREQKIIETQKALIADLKEELERSHRFREIQQQYIENLIVENSELKARINATDIDFPNSQKGGSDSTGAVNVSDILNS